MRSFIPPRHAWDARSSEYVPSEPGTFDRFIAAVSEARHPPIEIDRTEPGFLTAAWFPPLPLDVAVKAGELIGVPSVAHGDVTALRWREDHG